jgi:hypothetical protein
MPDNKDSESKGFIERSIERSQSHIVRHSDDIDGIVTTEVRSDGNYNIKIHKGTEDKPTVIENVSKEKLIDMMQKQL